MYNFGKKKRVPVVTNFFDTAVNDFDAKKSARCSRLFVVTEFVLSRTQCILVHSDVHHTSA